MDGSTFDALSRSWSEGASRRAILGGLGVALSLTALHAPETAEARKKRRKKRRKKQQQPKTCPQCGVCETCVNGTCKLAPSGTPCGDGGECLANGSCAETCTPGACNAACMCSLASTEGKSHCVTFGVLCDQWPSCVGTAECPPDSHCQFAPNCGVGEYRCVPLCPF